MRVLIALLLIGLSTASLVSTDSARLEVPTMRTPKDEHATFRVHAGFRVELVACEPQVIDPVSLTFDPDGRLFVCEMPGYPNEGSGVGNISSGRIKCLRDEDGDGFYEKATVFADQLRFPLGVVPYRGGLIAAVAPDLIELRDTDGDGRAESRRVLYTGFGIDNVQQLLNSPLWGLDNWVYVCNGTSGGTIRSLEQQNLPPVVLGNRNIRFRPDRPGSLEPASGGGQYGLTINSFQDLFLNTNSEHLKQVVLPDHYLRRNPLQAAPTPWSNIAEHGPACSVFRVSAFEPWRVERTRRRASGSDAARFARTELVPGGFVTSSCSPLVYEADRFPERYRGNVFICEPANNLIFRDALVAEGPLFRARRVDDKQEFLASTDNCFRPVHLCLGPDGGVYVCDFYRPVIETPRSLPDDMKAQLPLQSQGRGRIWRIVPVGSTRPAPPQMSRTPTEALVPFLEHPNLWWRINAQRVLIERGDLAALTPLRRLVQGSASEFGRAHALWTLDGLGGLDAEEIVRALKDPSALVRCQALRLAESRMRQSPVLRAAAACADHESPRVRFQAAFSLGESVDPEAVSALARIARRDGANEWFRAAILSSAHRTAEPLLRALTDGPAVETLDLLIARLASQIAVSADDEKLAEMLSAVVERSPRYLRIIGEGLALTKRPLTELWRSSSPTLGAVAQRLQGTFEQAGQVARDDSKSLAERIEALKLVGFAPFDIVVGSLKPLLEPRQPVVVQVHAIRAISQHRDAGVADILLAHWSMAGPEARRELQEALFARPERVSRVVEAMEQKLILPKHLDPARVAQIRKWPDPGIRQRAEKLLADAIDRNRRAVIDRFRSALDLPGDRERGRSVFQRVCAACHRLNDMGHEVGPDLKTAVGDKTPEQLLVAIFDPSRELDRRYANYLIDTTSGQRLTGMIASESATSITLRRAERIEDVILRSQIESITDTNQSLMPEGLEEQLKPQDVADLLIYLRSIR
jgi:putative membrane-bound dehydrogenase-like protein